MEAKDVGSKWQVPNLREFEEARSAQMLASYNLVTHPRKMQKCPAIAAYCLIAGGLLSTHAAHIGQKETAVLEAHGAPNSILHKGNKRILIYPEGRIRLEAGKVVEISGKLAPADPTSEEPAKVNLPARTLPAKSVAPDPIPAHLQPIADELVDKRHVRIENPGLEKARYLLIYFADGASKASANTTTQLRYYYETKKSGHNFEVLFVSADRNSNKMANHMAKQSMPWPAVRFQATEASGLLEYRGKTLPAMALLDAEGRVIASSEVDGQYKGCGFVLDALSKRL